MDAVIWLSSIYMITGFKMVWGVVMGVCVPQPVVVLRRQRALGELLHNGDSDCRQQYFPREPESLDRLCNAWLTITRQSLARWPRGYLTQRIPNPALATQG